MTPLISTHRLEQLTRRYQCEISEFIPQRRSEFLAGRYLAENTLSFFDHVDCKVGRDKYGSPIWPDGIKGSISHEYGLIGVYIYRCTNTQGVGIDIHKMLDRQSADRLLKFVDSSTDAHFTQLACKSGLYKYQLINILICAKEAAIKAIPSSVAPSRFTDILTKNVYTFSKTGSNWVVRLTYQYVGLITVYVRLIEGFFIADTVVTI